MRSANSVISRSLAALAVLAVQLPSGLRRTPPPRCNVLECGEILGVVIKTAASGGRIQLESTGGFQAIDSGENVRVRIPTTGSAIEFFDTSSKVAEIIGQAGGLIIEPATDAVQTLDLGTNGVAFDDVSIWFAGDVEFKTSAGLVRLRLEQAGTMIVGDIKTSLNADVVVNDTIACQHDDTANTEFISMSMQPTFASIQVGALGTGTDNPLDFNIGGSVILRLDTDGALRVGSTTGPKFLSGSGTPEGSITAPVGSQYMRTDGGAGTSLYVKESGTGNTGWVAK